ncbi:phospholipase A2 inhibitor and Ly6/PLAUR domain-containing protein-like [Erpetoichthys calabaricus]|uniref:phospholipase A2 inhibitor and Ly6/PLAUR domain-containing protein-like n=1 Tax=Erpetoichthys calabaricus TaxID=27687 RepID=UPI0022347BF8|nr:phospholipase A2 inhibitor and Ly6/PLAUR domain-containing protein-like [Erpetoichthys calabaricus]
MCLARRNTYLEDTEQFSFVLAHQAINVSYQTCGSPSSCEENISLNFGITQTTVNSQCCDKDLCNTEFPKVSSNDTVNGLECCQDEHCSEKIQCVGNEKVCLKMQSSAAGIHSEMRGCATSNLCAVQSYQVPGVVQGTLYCCSKSLCNSAKLISVNILVLLLPLLLYKLI